MNSGSAEHWESAARRVLSPPLREPRFWILQLVVVGLAMAHLILDIVSAVEPSTIPAGVPVALLLAPVSYAALRYGLSGSVATALWAILLWLPDLMLPRDRGHVGNDLIELALVLAVAVFVGYHIDAERAERAHAQVARTEQQVAQARYRQLFNTNAAPILVASEQGTIVDANPAARALVPGKVVGCRVGDILGLGAASGVAHGTVISLPEAPVGLRYYRVNAAEVPGLPGQEPVWQLVLQDITEDRAEGDRAHRFAELLLTVQEEERRRIAQDLHDEPLQLLVHLARTMERLEVTTGANPEADRAALTGGLVAAREQTLDIASRLRAVMAGLRPAALEQLGLIAALRGFLADLGETTMSLRADLRVRGEPARLRPDIELSAFRIVQEATNNVIKHSEARRLMVTIAFADSELKLQVNDDGRGFDPRLVDGQLAAGHLGLLGMRERAMLVGGELTVHSQPGHGALIEASIPIGATPQAAAGMPAVNGQLTAGPVAS
ncbi:MAG: sensor histidine kinase [Streptosporangiaceae bacterium]